ncbi:MAG: CoA transferase, partial [SAR324 cluster bacterium]|nr:CoA transferase [SAR324 cluster bacterium]
MTKLPLQGLRVADFSQGVAGPYCALLLGDLGAEVVKVEPPRGDWIRVVGRKVEAGMSPTYISMNRNKKAFCLEMKDPGGLEAARRLAGKSDVVVESFRPGVMKRFGLDHETLSGENPQMVYASVTGFGNSGPYVDLPGADSVIQAMGGIMSINGEAGGDPLRFGMFMVDMITGMSAYQGLLAALLGRERGGGGQYLSVSLLDAILSFQAPPLTEYLMYGALPERNGNVNSYVAPSGVFKTRDSFLMFTTLDHQWERGAKALGLESLVDDPRYVSNDARLANRDSLLEMVREKVAKTPEGFPPHLETQVVRTLEALLAVSTDSDGPQLQGEALQHEVYEACHSMWHAAASFAPTVLVIDDMHWADPASVELMIDMFPLVDEVPLLLLCSFRPERQSPAWRVKQAAETDYPH